MKINFWECISLIYFQKYNRAWGTKHSPQRLQKIIKYTMTLQIKYDEESGRGGGWYYLHIDLRKIVPMPRKKYHCSLYTLCGFTNWCTDPWSQFCSLRIPLKSIENYPFSFLYYKCTEKVRKNNCFTKCKILHIL